jgi:micrococcal nuclease
VTRLLTILVISIILAATPAFPWSGECVWVRDGDWIIVKHDRKLVEIGFHGISCPMWQQRFALEAAQFTDPMVRGKTVKVGPEKGQGRVRTFARFSVDGKTLNQELLREGFAWWSKKYASDDSDLAEAQAQAIKNKVGVWSDPDPVLPRKFRGKGGGYKETGPE